MSSKGDTPAVTAEDQKKINRFARLHQKAEELKAELKLKTNDLQNLNDAADELLLVDSEEGGGVPLRVGEVFVMYSADDAADRLEVLKGELEGELDAVRSRQALLEGEMARLKVELYGKFGTNINLEADDGD